MKITTNNIPRQLVTFYDIPLSAQLDFDYIRTSESQYEYRFVQYKGNWYDTYDTQRIAVNHGQYMGWTMSVDKDSPLSKYNAVISETYFSGILFKFIDDSVICANYYS